VIPGSSFFGPQKNNPTIPETVIQACFLVFGRTRTALAAIEHAELHLNVFESTAAFSSLESAQILKNALHLLNSHCLPGIQPGPSIGVKNV
jgi:aspartate ammonia-lyase